VFTRVDSCSPCQRVAWFFLFWIFASSITVCQANSFSDFVWVVVDGSRSCLEPPDQRFELFLFIMTFLWWFHFHVRKLFGEVFVRLREVSFYPILVVVVSLVTLHAPVVIFRCDYRLPNPIPRTNSFSITIWCWLSYNKVALGEI
jgi:hypothetical protein